MKEVLLILAVAALFIIAYYAVDRFGKYVDDAYKESGTRNGPGRETRPALTLIDLLSQRSLNIK